MARAPLTFRRLAGLDRSGPPPPQTVRGAPLHPWTLPNVIAFARLCSIPVFLAVALNDDDGHGALLAVLFGVIGWSDYLDGIVARLTGQFSRLGALLDPVADRLLVISGMVVAWRFDLLPRWAIALLVAREVYILVFGRLALAKGADVAVNWPGRLAVAPVLGAPFFAMAGLDTVGTVLLFIGLALSLWAAVLYTRAGIAYSRAQRSSRA